MNNIGAEIIRTREHLAARLYFLSAIGIMLTAGAGWGVWLLWAIAAAGNFRGAGIHQVNAHGHAQIFGWVGLFLLGFLLDALPRLWRVALPAPRLIIAGLVTLVAAIAVRSVAMGFGGTGAAWAAPTALAAGVVEFAALAAIVALIATAFIRSRQPGEPYGPFLLAGLGWLLIQSAFGVWHVSNTMTAPNRDDLLWYVSTYQGPLRYLQMHGLALFMLLGLSMRMLPPMFGVAPVGRRRARWGFAILLLAVVGEVVLFIVFRWTASHAVAGALLACWVMLLVGVVILALPWKLSRPTPRRDRSAKFVRAAYGWLALSLTMLVLLPVYQLVSGLAFSHAYYGAVRHAFAVGFISLLIMGIAAKVVPDMTGRGPLPASALWLAFILVNLGCALRVTTQTLTDWNPLFYDIIGISGALEWVGLALWSVYLAVMLVRR